MWVWNGLFSVSWADLPCLNPRVRALTRSRGGDTLFPPKPHPIFTAVSLGPVALYLLCMYGLVVPGLASLIRPRTRVSQPVCPPLRRLIAMLCDSIRGMYIVS